ncbi:MAG: porin OmpA [Aeromonas sp.]
MKKSHLSALIGALLLPLAASAASLNLNPWYVGAKAGWSAYSDVELNQDLASGFAPYSSDAKADDLGLGLWVGYQLDEHLAFEFGYDWLGEYELAGGPVTSRTRSQLLHSSFKWGYTVAEPVELFARLGAGYGWTQQKLSIDQQGEGSGHYRGAAFIAGLGLQYTLNPAWALRFEYQYSSPLGSTSPDRSAIELDNGLLALGVVHRFGARAPAFTPAIAPSVVAPAVAVAAPQHFSLSSDVLFAFNSSELTAAGYQALDELFARILAAQPQDGQATVTGFTDRLGTPAYNQTLSQRRAQQVADYLVQKGLFAHKVQAIGRGETAPLTGQQCQQSARPALIACLAPDRRVEITLHGTSQPSR